MSPQSASATAGIVSVVLLVQLYSGARRLRSAIHGPIVDIVGV